MVHIDYNNMSSPTIPGWATTYMIEHFSWSAGTKTVWLSADATLYYLAILDESTDLSIDFTTVGTNATVHVFALLMGKKSAYLKATIHAHIHHAQSTAHMHLISFLPTQASIHVDGWVTIHPDVSKWAGHLLEENIILGEGVHIKTLPMLDVQSNDVSASHGARIEQLDKKKLFYAQSRGLDGVAAKWLLIRGYIDQCFSAFLSQEADPKNLEDLQEQLFHEIMQRG